MPGRYVPSRIASEYTAGIDIITGFHLFDVSLRNSQFLSIDQRKHYQLDGIKPSVIAMRDCRGKWFFRYGDIQDFMGVWIRKTTADRG